MRCWRVRSRRRSGVRRSIAASDPLGIRVSIGDTLRYAAYRGVSAERTLRWGRPRRGRGLARPPARVGAPAPAPRGGGHRSGRPPRRGPAAPGPGRRTGAPLAGRTTEGGVLRVRDLRKTYGDRVALAGVDLDVGAGTILGL